jgi:hypothetical protein
MWLPGLLSATLCLTASSCMKTDDIDHVILSAPSAIVTFNIPHDLIVAKSDDHYFVTLAASYPSFGPVPATIAPDLFLTLKVAGRETNAEKLVNDDPNRPGVNVPRLVRSDEGTKVFHYQISPSSPLPAEARIYNTTAGWLRVDDTGTASETLTFNRRFEAIFELQYQVKRGLVTDPVALDAQVSDFIHRLRGDN